MTLSSIGKTSSSWPMIAPVLASTSLDLRHFSRGGTIVIGSFLLAGVVAAAVAKYRSRSENAVPEHKSGPEKISVSLVALSSAAVLAVYAAGYWRTQSAEQQYLQQAEARQLSYSTRLRIETPPPPPNNGASAPSPGQLPQSAPAPPHKKNRAASTPTPSNSPVTSPSPAPNGVPVGISTDDPAILAGNNVQPKDSRQAPQPKYKDGTYFGWGSCRHGDIQAAVEIKGGRIASTYIAMCWTRYSCSVIGPLPGQVVSRQSADVDNISGATESSDAFFSAITDALSRAK